MSVSSLDELYQKEYVPKCINLQVKWLTKIFWKIHFTLQGWQMFLKLKEGVDHSDTSQLHIKHYFSKYLGWEGVVDTQQLQKVFDECYMKELKMPLIYGLYGMISSNNSVIFLWLLQTWLYLGSSPR